MRTFSNKEIEELVGLRFILDCPKITFVQQIEAEALTFTGSGTIWQDEKGVLKLKFIHPAKAGDDFGHYNNVSDTKTGNLIEKNRFFHLCAQDAYGTVWEAEDISLDGSVYPACRVIETKLSKISCVKELEKKEPKYLGLIMHGKTKVPCTKFIDLGERSSLIECPLDISGAVGEIIEKEDHLVINLRYGDVINTEFKKKFIQSLDIIFGKLNYPILSILIDGDKKTQTISSLEPSYSNRTGFSFIQHNFPWAHKDFLNFINSYISTFSSNDETFYRFWHKIHMAWQSDLENSALALCVSVEGVLKHYFKDLGKTESALIDDALKAVEQVESLKLPSRIESMLIGRLKSLNNVNPNTVLYSLKSMFVIRSEHIASWKKLRNKSAHAGKIGNSPQKIQQHLNLIWSTESLFSLLLMHFINYNGFYSGWSCGERNNKLLFVRLQEREGYNSKINHIPFKSTKHKLLKKSKRELFLYRRAKRQRIYTKLLQRK